MPRHSNDSKFCVLCSKKTDQVSGVLSFLFAQIRDEFPDCHMSWGYRDEKQQQEQLEKGYTQVRFPGSKHNRVPAEAMDLFQLKDGKAVFDKEYYEKVAKFVYTKTKNVKWGGSFKKPDFPHFELSFNHKEEKSDES